MIDSTVVVFVTLPFPFAKIPIVCQAEAVIRDLGFKFP